MSKDEKKSSSLKHSHKEHIVADILPAREIHLYSGPSGGGKTTTLVKIAESIARGEDVYGHEATPTPFVYISGDRSYDDMLRTMDRLHVDPEAFPLYIPDESKEVKHVIDRALTKFPEARLVIVEGFATYVPGGKIIDYGTVATFLRSLQRYCYDKNITLWGVVHDAKVKSDGKYLSPRERIMGSAAWGAYANTVFHIEPMEPDNTEKSSARKLMILPRNGKDEHFRLDFRDGLLVQVPGSTNATPIIMNTDVFKEWFNKIEIGATFTLAQFRDSTNMSDSSARWEIRKQLGKSIERDNARPQGTFIKTGVFAEPKKGITTESTGHVN